jgi:hypothetical protein
MSVADAFKEAEAEQARKASKKVVGQVADLLTRNGIDPSDVGSIKKVDVRQRFYKDNDGEAQLIDVIGISLSPKWADGPEWPVIHPAAVRKFPKAVRSRAAKKWITAALLPDMQIGYFHNADGKLEAIQDEDAIATSIAICKDEQPGQIVLHGDNADFATLGKYRLSPAYALTTQATIDRCALLGEQLREACPNAEIIWLEGNHEARLSNFILDNAAAAFGIRQGHIPDGWPVLSMPHLCGFDVTGIQYISGYPAGEFWLNDNFRVIHGDKVKSSGSTAHMYLDDARVSTAYGHIHRRELAQRTRHTRNGPRTVTAVSFGCLCRLDGVVPSTKGGMDIYGRPVKVTENWQNGMGFVRYQPGDGLHVIESIEILRGWAMWNGREYGVEPKRHEKTGN